MLPSKELRGSPVPGAVRRGRPWAESAVWGTLWLLSTGETPAWLADHQPSRIRRRLASLRPSGLLWAVRNRGELRRFAATSKVLEALRPFLHVGGAAALGMPTPNHLEGYLTPERLRWIRRLFPVVPLNAGNLILRVSDQAALLEANPMPVAFAAADMAESDEVSQAERGLLLLDDLLREFSHDHRRWMTAPEISAALSDELDRGDELFALRMMSHALTDFRALDEPADIVRFLDEPATTGDERWDALLACAVARECRLKKLAAPEWTDIPPLQTWWFPALIDESLLPLTIERTPPELSSKGVWLDERALVAA